MIKVNVHEAKTKLSSLILAVEKSGEKIRICRNGKAVVDLVPIAKKSNPLKANPKLKVKFKEDPTLPLNEDDWPGLG